MFGIFKNIGFVIIITVLFVFTSRASTILSNDDNQSKEALTKNKENPKITEYADNEEEIIYDYGGDIYVQFEDGTGRRLLVNKNFTTGLIGLRNPVWSKNGMNIAFKAWDDIFDYIFFANSDGSEIKEVFRYPKKTVEGDDAYIADGLNFAYNDKYIICKIVSGGIYDDETDMTFTYLTKVNVDTKEYEIICQDVNACYDISFWDSGDRLLLGKWTFERTGIAGSDYKYTNYLYTGLLDNPCLPLFNPFFTKIFSYEVPSEEVYEEGVLSQIGNVKWVNKNICLISDWEYMFLDNIIKLIWTKEKVMGIPKTRTIILPYYSLNWVCFKDSSTAYIEITKEENGNYRDQIKRMKISYDSDFIAYQDFAEGRYPDFRRRFPFPDKPIITTPVNKATDVSLYPVIEWGLVQNAEYYKVKILDKDLNPVFEKNNITTNRIQATTALEPGETYACTVSSCNSKNTKSSGITFTTQSRETLHADFTATPLQGYAPLLVRFFNKSTGVKIVSQMWDFGDLTSADENAQVRFVNPGIYDVKLTVKRVDNTIDTEIKKGFIIVWGTSTFVLDAGDDKNICSGRYTQIGGNDIAHGGAPPYTYKWTPSVGLNYDNIASPYASPTSTTVYKLEVTDSQGSIVTDYIKVTVLPVPIKPIISEIDETLLANSEGESYQWYYENNIIQNATESSYKPNISGRYKVRLWSTNGCTVESEFYDYDINSIEDVESEQTCVFPNPVDEKLMIRISENNLSRLRIIDMIGNKIFEQKYDNQFNNLEISTNNFPVGIYIIELTYNNIIVREKIIINR